MSRAETNKLYNDFTKGLITEASYLTYPKDASIAEDNTVISRKGNRTRRVGIDFENGYVLENLGLSATEVVSEFVWTSANNEPDYNFVVVQSGSIIYFYRMNSAAISANKQSFTINLTDYILPGINATKLHQQFASFSAGAGFLFVAHKYCDPISVAFDPKTNTISAIRVVVQIRDFDGVYDGLPNDAEPVSLSPQHQYNLMNQGWIATGSNVVPGSSVSGPSYPSFGYVQGGNVLFIDPATGNAVFNLPGSDPPPYFGNHGQTN